MLKADGYRLINKLGRGSFGEVWLAEEDSNKEHVAIKFLLDSQFSANFAREVRNLHRQIDNYYVVEIFRWNLDATPPYFVMEYCQGGSLRHYCGNRQEWKNVAFILMNVINGLHGIHKTGGFHRDIKPDNILLSHDEKNAPVYVLSDMGLARIPTLSLSSTMTESPHGTDAYKAPELFLPNARFTDKCDIYSLGVTMIELLIGKRETFLMHSLGVPVRFTNLLNRMVSTAPDQRPDTVAIGQELNRLTEPDSPTPPSDSPPNLGTILLGGLAIVGLIKLLAGGDEKYWDEDVKRYRGEDGKFRS